MAVVRGTFEEKIALLKGAIPVNSTYYLIFLDFGTVDIFRSVLLLLHVIEYIGTKWVLFSFKGVTCWELLDLPFSSLISLRSLIC